MQKSKLFIAIIFSITIIISGFASAQAQSGKKGNGGNSPTPIGIQVAQPVDRSLAKVNVVSGSVRTAGANVFADVRWEFFAPQGSRVETVDVEVIGDLGNNSGVSEKKSFGAVNSGALFLSEISKHAASDFRGLNAKVVVNFRDLNNNQLFAKGAVKNFVVTVKPSAPPKTEPVRVVIKPTQVDGLKTFMFWDVSGLGIINRIEKFEVSITADLDRGQGVRQETFGRDLQNPNDRSTAFNFAQNNPQAFGILKTRVVVVAFVRDLNTNFVDRVLEIREDVFPRAPLPVVNLAVSELKTSLNNLVSVSWAINAESQVRIVEFQIKLATTFSNNTAIISDFKASSQSRNFSRSFLPQDGPPNGFRQVLATVTAKLEDPATGRRFDVVASRKLN